MDRIKNFLCLLVSAVLSNARHHCWRHYVSPDLHKPWTHLLSRPWRWLNIPVRGLWTLADVAGAADLPVDDGQTLFHRLCAGDMDYYTVIHTNHGAVPWPMVRSLYEPKG